MIPVHMRLVVRLGPLQRLVSSVRAQLGDKADGPLRRAFSLMAVAYRAEMQERFDRYSKGGGDWKPLAPSTIRKRRRGRLKKIKNLHGAAKAAHERRVKANREGGSSAAILRDKGLLFAALNPVYTGAAGQYEEHVANGIVVGFGGAAGHGGDRVTVAQLAAWHNEGGPNGRPPKRQLLTLPSTRTVATMVKIAQRALQPMIDKHNRET